MLLQQRGGCGGVALPWLATTAFVALALVAAAARVQPSTYGGGDPRQQGALRSFWGRQSVATHLSGFIITPRIAVSAATSPIVASDVVIPEYEDEDEDMFLPSTPREDRRDVEDRMLDVPSYEKLPPLHGISQSHTPEREDPDQDPSLHHLLHHLIQSSLSSDNGPSSPPPRLTATISQRMPGGRGTSVAMAAAAAAGVGAAWGPNLDDSLIQDPANKVTQLNVNEPRAKRVMCHFKICNLGRRRRARQSGTQGWLS